MRRCLIVSFYLGDSHFRHICTQQITDLSLIINENNVEITDEDYTNSVYEIIFAFFENLRHLTIVLPSSNNYPLLSLYKSPSKTCFSLTLTKLCINAHNFNDVLALLDGRLKQLTTFVVQVDHINNRISTVYKMNDLPALKYFSLTCYEETGGYNISVLPLLHRISHLEELTLYIHITDGSTFITGTHLDNEILIHMPQLHTFTFYIACETVINDPVIRISSDDIQ
ncbi:unnamed protein product [Rotaria sp. Silwood2]|nr:unnamed protein product [Rotaria sp. Silwood2]CAF2748603.1 unnamed protein product [Rotaria sp. Silwood2]CAF3008054.1 unnamed protein product [Rotaria sp. Silwood2]CAF3163346.1 unnamed protein product [Rotaria sp. Silwood2]CAF4031623.1 unnamed protein product [Rotaria sp. Silwood2]